MAACRTSIGVLSGFAIACLLVACLGRDADPSTGSANDDDAATPEVVPTPVEGGPPAIAPDAAPSLACPLGCLPPAQSGWVGPSAVYNGPSNTKPTTCPPPYVQSEVDANQEMDPVPEAQCGCPHSGYGGTSCKAVVKLWAESVTSGCPAGQEVTLNPIDVPGANDCVARGFSYSSIKVTSLTFSPGKCLYFPGTIALPKVTFKTATVACGLPQFATCTDRPDCVASPGLKGGFSRLCIHKAGDESCPSLDYTQRFVARRSVVEGRSCSTCEGTVSGSCGTTYTFSANAQCSNTILTSATVNQCAEMGSFANLDGLQPTNLSCTLTGGKPQGTVTEADPVTFCCNK